MIDMKKMKEELLSANPTLYCSARAHVRGKLHMTKLNGSTFWDIMEKDCWNWFGYSNKECIADERRHMFHWTMEDQEKLVRPILDQYNIEEEEPVVQWQVHSA